LNKNTEVTQLLLENQYKYPALPPVVPYGKRTVTEKPMPISIDEKIDNCIVDLKNPIHTKVRYVVVYGAQNGVKLNTNDASQMMDKIVFNQNPIIIPFQNLKNCDALAISFIDYFGNESESTILNLSNNKHQCKSH
jgi:hypothetical protein